MPLNRDFIGRSYDSAGTLRGVPASTSGGSRRRSATRQPGLHRPARPRRQLGHPDVIAPPTFLTTVGMSLGGGGPISDPELGLNYALSCTASSASSTTARYAPATC